MIFKHVYEKTGCKNLATSNEGYSALHMAAQEGNLEVFIFISENEMDKNPGDHTGQVFSKRIEIAPKIHIKK